MLGKTADQIKQMCRWKSNTSQKYIGLGFYIKYQKQCGYSNGTGLKESYTAVV
jgi:hypothetical protein